jgi:ABC-type multidrug transport system ATPase subunit
LEITLENIGKKFSRNWVFRNVNLSIENNESLVVLGQNGSGKSTFLQIISGLNLPSEGSIKFHQGETEIDAEMIYQEVSMAAPYMELLETLTLQEMLKVHFKFKKPIGDMSLDAFFELTYLTEHINKEISDLSSGMKQRLKLGLAILSETDLLLLDEPLINLDDRGKKMYFELIEKYGKTRNIVVCSNHQKEEYEFCTKTLNLSEVKAG